MMIRSKNHFALALLTAAQVLGAMATNAQSPKETPMRVQYLEIVTSDVEATCDALAKIHGASFGEPVAGFGNARIAALENGSQLGVRAPMADHEQPVVRPYLLVDDIDAAVGAAESAGAVIALPAIEIPGSGKYAIYILGGIQHGLWQLEAAAD